MDFTIKIRVNALVFAFVFMLVTLSESWCVNSLYRVMNIQVASPLLLLSGCVCFTHPKATQPTPPMPVHSELIAPLGGQS